MEDTGIVWKLRETGGMHRPELDGDRWNTTEHTGSYLYRTGPGSVNPYSYPCRHVRASDLWCRRRRDVSWRGDVEEGIGIEMRGIEQEMSEIWGELWGTLPSTKILAVTTDRLILYTIYLVGVNFLP